MKRLTKSSLLIGALLIPIQIKAASSNITISCPESVIAKENIECIIKQETTAGVVNGISANYNIDDNFKVTKFVNGTEFETTFVNNKNGFAIGNDSGVSKTNEIGRLYLTVDQNVIPNENYTIGLKNIDLSDIDYISEDLKNVSTTIRIKSDTNSIKKLKIGNNDIKLIKDKTTYFFDVNYNVNNILIEAEVTDSKSSFVNNYSPRLVNLNYGNNIIYLKVQSESGKERTYTLNINRNKKKENTTSNKQEILNKTEVNNNTKLKDLKINYGTLEFDKNKNEYTVEVPYNIKTIELTATPENQKSTIKIDGPKELQIGENVYSIKVTSESGEEETYNIKVIRNEEYKETVKKEEKKLNVWLIIFIILSIGLIGALLILITKIKKDKNKEW